MQEALFGGEDHQDQKGKPELVSRGEFWATKDLVMEYVRRDSEAKLHGLALHILKMPTKLDRQKWLSEFQEKHGEFLTNQLKAEISSLHASRK